jgi:glycine/D-amino acid oxidase-like deaminating enzyme
MNLSFWERDRWFSNVDYVIVGSGIVGLHAALRLRVKFPSSKILVLEKGVLPQGASTKNAGFACFGSLSEITSDLKNHSPEEIRSLVKKRWDGLGMLRAHLGDQAVDFRSYGGYELFTIDQKDEYQTTLDSMESVNRMLRPIFGEDVFVTCDNSQRFGNITGKLLYNKFEGQIDTGMMMQSLLKKAYENNILILNCQDVTGYTETSGGVEVMLGDFSFYCKKLLFATNGFAEKLTAGLVKPARAQVLITDPIQNLHIKGTFHLEQGFYYFRNIGDRILLGGGRNLAFEQETTTGFGLTQIIQDRLETLLKEVILPDTPHMIEHRWSGIMGMGESKSPIVRQISDHVYCGVRMGGMGVAIGSIIGTELADLI